MSTIRRPRLGQNVHRLLCRPIRRDLFSRFRHRRPLAEDQVQVTWLGTAGFTVEYAGHTLLLDPYLSRPGLRKSLAGPLLPDVEAIRRFAPRADVIVAGHSHSDHILDIPEIARLTGARVVGSASTSNLCRGYGLSASQILEVEAPQTVEVGPFRITVRPSLHGKAVMGRVPLVGQIPQGAHPPLRFQQYLNDTTFGTVVECLGESSAGQGLTLFHLGSADFYPETIEGQKADVLLPCLMGREHHPGFVRELLDQLQPRVVIPCHFDDFFVPMEQPIRELPGADLEGFRQDVLHNSVSTRLVILEKLGSFRCGLNDPALPERTWS